ncbi:MAG: efflux RND transporter periplasmic adaptor subunit, partial [bacterium]|nr:efflux RND transporter periplasmic adaptor subunit [bacterium]
MTNESTTRSGRRRYLGALGWLAAGFLLAVLLFVDPLGLHPLDEWVAGVGSAPEISDADAGQDQLWTCGMHPDVIQNEPGQCPICQMDLVPLRTTGEHTGHGHEAAAHPEAATQLWTCPEHPFIEESEPGECPVGGRELVAAEVEEASGQGAVVRINPAVVQNMNVQSVPVTRRDLKHRIRTVGYLEYDQEHMVSVTTKYSGWVERVYVNYVGEPVKKGQPLFEIYSPELVQTEQELLSALSFARRMEQAPGESRRRAQDLVEAARTRMGYWDISPQQLDELERTGEVFR